MGTNLEPTRLRIDALAKRVAYLENIVETLVDRLDTMNARFAVLESEFDEHVDDELMEKLDFHR